MLLLLGVWGEFCRAEFNVGAYTGKMHHFSRFRTRSVSSGGLDAAKATRRFTVSSPAILEKLPLVFRYRSPVNEVPVAVILGVRFELSAPPVSDSLGHAIF